MTRRKILGSIALTIVIGLLASCSDDKKVSSISKAEFLAQGNALCATFDQKMDDASANVTSQEAAVLFVGETLVSEMRALLRSIEKLGYPEGDGEHIQGLIDDTDDVVDQIAANPSAYAPSPTDPFAAINAQLNEYGLTSCGDGGDG